MLARAHVKLISLDTHVVQNDKGLGPATLSITNGMEDTATDNSRQKLLNEESQESTTDQSQVEVVNQEETLELERLAVAQPLATTDEDAGVGVSKGTKRNSSAE